MKYRVVLDTNILISSLIFGGKPREILSLVIDRKIVFVSSNILLSELFEILSKKFDFSSSKIKFLEKKLRKIIFLVYPKKRTDVLKDDDDNRVLEAAEEGACSCIVTGDKQLLELKKYKKIRIVTADIMLQCINTL